MAGGGFVRLPDGTVIVALSLAVSKAAPGAVPGAAPAAVRGGAAPGGGSDRDGAHGGPYGPYGGVTGLGGWPWRRRPATAEEAVPQPRHWSAHADTPHTVRGAAWWPGGEDEPRVRVLVHAGNRARALTRLRNLGMRAVYLRGNTEPPTPDEVTAVLHHPDGLVWRARPGADTDSWQPIAALLRTA
jgi:hypothetical protein